MSEQTTKQRAEQLVIDFVKKRRVGKDGIPIAHSISAVRSHFDTLKMSRVAAGLDVNFSDLIDQLIKAGVVQVTNEFAWIRTPGEVAL